MKNFIIYLTVGICVLVAACSDDNDTAITFALDKNEITIGADGARETINVTAAGEWYASADEPWICVSPANGIGSAECTVNIDSTLTNDIRTANIQFIVDGHPAQKLAVTQTGYGNIIRTDSAELHIKASQRIKDDRYFTLSVTTNVAFDIAIDYESDTQAWLTPQTIDVTLDHGARPRTAKLRFDWTNNSNPELRIATINFIPKDPTQKLDKPSTVTIIQEAAQLIEDNRQGDSLAVMAISQALGEYYTWDTSESMANMDNVRLWERNDKELPCNEAIGRVREVRFYMMNTNEQLPAEVRYLKYAESLSFFSNVNSFLKSLELGSDICSLKHLRSLEVYAYGLIDLPQELTQLGGTLECLKLGGNNFKGIPSVLTKENFPKLKELELQGCRRWTVSDLRNAKNKEYEGGIGMHFNTANDDALRRLLLWDNLETLVLSYNYIEGELPDFEVGDDGVVAWSQADMDAWGGDTIQWLVDKQMPKILPHTTHLTLNLNFFTGNMPDWLLYHPRLLDWVPEQLVFNQMEYGIDSRGQVVRFNNTPPNFEYYYDAFPKYRSKYEIKEENE